MQIGTIVSSRSHTLYTCRILGRGEAAEAFSPADHALGTLVGMRPEDVTVAILTDTSSTTRITAAARRASPSPTLWLSLRLITSTSSLLWWS